jgi:hypothetical protein
LSISHLNNLLQIDFAGYRFDDAVKRLDDVPEGLLDLVAVSGVDQHVDGANLPLSSNSGVGYGMNGMRVPSWPLGGAARPVAAKCGECTPVRAELLHDGKIVVQMSVHSAAASPRRRRTKRPLGGKREYAHTSNAWRWS